MRAWWLAVPAAAFLLAAGAAAADAEKRVGVVDMERLLRAHPDFAPAEARLEKKKQEFEVERDKLLKDIDALKQELEGMAAQLEDKALSEDGRKRKREEAEDKLKEIRESQMQVRETSGLRQRQLSDQAKRMRKVIVARINEVVADYAKKNRYQMILDVSGMSMNGFPPVAYSDPALDVTEPLLKVVAALPPSLKGQEEKAEPESKSRSSVLDAPASPLDPSGDKGE